jgi:hypothetical protein
MELVLINDMRAPDWGTKREDLFDAALDIAEWADRLGFDVLGFGEHHNSDDGYNPSPLILASAMAARTKQIRLRSAILLASCYDMSLVWGLVIAGLSSRCTAIPLRAVSITQ